MELLWLYITLGVIGAAVLIALFVWFNNDCLKTTRYKIQIEGAPKLKIVHLSDLHGKRFGRRNCRLIKKVADEAPDFIAITGDIIHLYTERNKEVAVEAVSSLKEIAPVYYIDGLKLVGLNGAFLRNLKIDEITPESSPKMLLAHEPQYFEKYARAEYDLVLCGHAHGGQWRIPFTKIGLFAPGQGAFPKYTAGVHTQGKTRMIISRGLGNSEFPLRLFNRPEIVVIEIN